MAVSGRKFDELKDSLSYGSAEDFDICCDPCKHLSQTAEAKGFCVNCEENLCKRCVDAHKGLKLCRHHHILGQPQKIPAKVDDSNICTAYCEIHKNKVIKFFCPENDSVGCSDCMTAGNSTFPIMYIQNVCSGILKSEEFDNTIQEVSATIEQVDLVVNESKKVKRENQTSLDKLLKEIEKYQKKINDRIEQLKQQIVKEANSHRSMQDQHVDNVADTCAKMSSKLKHVFSVLEDCQTKKLEAQAFVKMKRGQEIINSADIEEYAVVLSSILFEPNKKLEKIISYPNALGKIKLSFKKDWRDVNSKVLAAKALSTSSKLQTETNQMLQSFELQNDINVERNTDEEECYISGCAVIGADRLLLADCTDRKLKVVNVDIDSVVEELVLDTSPWDITVLPQDQVAVTMAGKSEIVFLETAEQLSRIRSAHVGRECWGIDCHQDNLYVVCEAPSSILVLNLQEVQYDISLQRALGKTFIFPSYIVAGKDGQTLYVSDWESNFVARLTIKGKIIGVFELKDPHGLLVLEDGSLLVCCCEPCTVHSISADLKQESTLADDVPLAQSLCYDRAKGQIYVGSYSLKMKVLPYPV